MTMSSFALPPRPQSTSQPQSATRNNTANPLKEHVNVYSVKQSNGAGGVAAGGKGGKGRVGGYASKEDAELVGQMGQMGLKVNYPVSKSPSPPMVHLAQMQNPGINLPHGAVSSTPALSPQDAIAFMQLQQAQIDAAASNPPLQAYLAMQAQAQRANLLAQLQQQQLEAQLLLHAANSPNVVELASPTMPAASTFMPPPPVPTAPRTKPPGAGAGSAFAAQMQARTKAREAREAAAASATAVGGHVRSASQSSVTSARSAGSAGSTKTGSSRTSPILMNSDSHSSNPSTRPVTPVIRITPALPSQPHLPSALGLGRPSGASGAPSPRLASTPTLSASPRLADALRSRERAVSQPLPSSGGVGGVRIVRQPHGPPGAAMELGERNFQSCIRKKAGLNLGVLGRRVEGTGTGVEA